MSTPEERNPSTTAFPARREPFGVAKTPEVKPESEAAPPDTQDWLNKTLAAGREERSQAQAAAAAPVVRKRPGLRRVKRVVRHVDPLSVLRMAFVYTGVFLILWMLFVAGLFWIAESQGMFKSLEELMTAFAFDWNDNITLFFVEKWAFLIGLTMAVLGSLLSVLMVFIYNVAADLFGGIELTHVERDL